MPLGPLAEMTTSPSSSFSPWVVMYATCQVEVQQGMEFLVVLAPYYLQTCIGM